MKMCCVCVLFIKLVFNMISFAKLAQRCYTLTKKLWLKLMECLQWAMCLALYCDVALSVYNSPYFGIKS